MSLKKGFLNWIVDEASLFILDVTISSSNYVGGTPIPYTIKFQLPILLLS